MTDFPIKSDALYLQFVPQHKEICA